MWVPRRRIIIGQPQRKPLIDVNISLMVCIVTALFQFDKCKVNKKYDIFFLFAFIFINFVSKFNKTKVDETNNALNVGWFADIRTHIVQEQKRIERHHNEDADRNEEAVGTIDNAGRNDSAAHCQLDGRQLPY